MATMASRTSKSEYVLKLWSHLHTRIDGIMNTKDSDAQITFADLRSFMSDSKNIKLTASFFNLLHSFCHKTPIQKQCAQTTKKAKLILSALMIVKFPNDVLDIADLKDLEPSSEECYKSAQNMIESILTFSDKTHKLECDDLLHKISTFEETFMDWKNKDLQKVLQSIINYYSQWMRSYKVLSKSSMNEAQKKLILNTLIETMNKTQQRIAKLVGNDKAFHICQQIKDEINAEAMPETIAENAQNRAQNSDEMKEETLEQKLAAKGVPMNLKSGRNLVKEIPKSEFANADSDEQKYTKTVNGQKMLDLDTIVMEEASKNYWTNFETEISANNFSILLELLTELLQRLKQLSPEKQHKHLDDLMDLGFIQQTIESGIDAKGFYGIFVGIWEQIRSLHSPNADEQWQLWHDHIIKQFGSDDNVTWAQLLSNVFNVFLRKIDKIEEQVKVIKFLQSKQKK